MENLLDDIELFRENKIDVAKEIEKIKCQTDLNYIDCVIELCNKFNIEIESIHEHIPKNIKEKIEADALELNLLKYKINTLV